MSDPKLSDYLNAINSELRCQCTQFSEKSVARPYDPNIRDNSNVAPGYARFGCGTSLFS